MANGSLAKNRNVYYCRREARTREAGVNTEKRALCRGRNFVSTGASHKSLPFKFLSARGKRARDAFTASETVPIFQPADGGGKRRGRRQKGRIEEMEGREWERSREAQRESDQFPLSVHSYLLVVRSIIASFN